MCCTQISLFEGNSRGQIQEIRLGPSADLRKKAQGFYRDPVCESIIPKPQ